VGRVSASSMKVAVHVEETVPCARAGRVHCHDVPRTNPNANYAAYLIHCNCVSAVSNTFVASAPFMVVILHDFAFLPGTAVNPHPMH
jgi:hypothetical protein